MIEDLATFMKNYADEIGAKFWEYDKERSVVIVPVRGGRIQTVYGTLKTGEKYGGHTGIEFTTKVCPLDDRVDLLKLLKAQGDYCHAKFTIKNNEVWVEASAYRETASEGTLKEIVREAAQLADTWEEKITGLDVN